MLILQPKFVLNSCSLIVVSVILCFINYSAILFEKFCFMFALIVNIIVSLTDNGFALCTIVRSPHVHILLAKSQNVYINIFNLHEKIQNV